MKTSAFSALAALLATFSCGDDNSGPSPQASQAEEAPAEKTGGKEETPAELTTKSEVTDQPEVAAEDDGGSTPAAVLDTTVKSMAIDATSKDPGTWAFLDLDSGSALTASEAAQLNAWDLAFSRFQIKTNGGASGTGKVEAALIQDQPFDQVIAAPAGNYGVDELPGPDPRTEPGFYFGGWYDYDFITHTLTARNFTYVVKTTEGAYFKVQILDYYDDAGTPGVISMKWAAVPAPK